MVKKNVTKIFSIAPSFQNFNWAETIGFAAVRKSKRDSRWILVALSRPIDCGHLCKPIPFFAGKEAGNIFWLD